jgi:uncharacterized membrane protein YdjX (TVP38/TMEM64 family)
LADAGPLAPILYVALKALSYVVAPLRFPGLTVAAGLLFGVPTGVALTILGEALGGCSNFWLSRLLGRAVVTRIGGAEMLTRVESLSHRVGGWRGLLFARLVIPGYDFVSYGAGLTSLHFGAYAAITIVAGIPPATLYVALGASLAEGSVLAVVVSAALAVLYGACSYALSVRYRRQRDAPGHADREAGVTLSDPP